MRQIQIAPVTGIALLPTQANFFKLVAITTRVTDDATSATRRPRLNITFGGIAQVLNIYTTTFDANEVIDICLCTNGAYWFGSPAGTAPGFIQAPLPPDLILDSRHIVQLEIENFQAGDAMTDVSFVIEEFSVDEGKR